MKESRADQKFADRGLFFADLYGFSNKLNAAEKSKLQELEKVLKEEIHPLLADGWDKAEYPLDAMKSIFDLHLIDDPALTEGRADKSTSELYRGFRAYT